MIQIINRYTRAVLYEAATAQDIRDAMVAAVASGANLSWAYLSGANLSGANLSGALGCNSYLTTPLHILRDQPGKIRAYKLVDANLMSPIADVKIQYVIGQEVSVPNASTDEAQQCDAGVNLASLDWCLREWSDGRRILVVEFEAADIAAIPMGSDGKFRVRRCLVVSEKPMSEWGDGPWSPKPEAKP
jgi:hypothetical protein